MAKCWFWRHLWFATKLDYPPRRTCAKCNRREQGWYDMAYGYMNWRLLTDGKT